MAKKKAASETPNEKPVPPAGVRFVRLHEQGSLPGCNRRTWKFNPNHGPYAVTEAIVEPHGTHPALSLTPPQMTPEVLAALPEDAYTTE